MRKAICLSLVVTIFFAGCAGREANPVAMYIPGDENRDCKSLLMEMSQIQQEMDVLRPKTNKFVTNAAWATAGVFFIFPFFFMDLKEAEKIEYDAYARRYNRLLIYATEKNCDMINLPTEPELTVEQKIEKEKAKKAAQEQKNHQ
ncbi:hypothetical protein GF366_03370 [Candidatus Peregrinibacteria bacterium]|jgi:hypothetical protein|nr:hypothetical protein [Candidatus Peregrinibacteria bacterium]